MGGMYLIMANPCLYRGERHMRGVALGIVVLLMVSSMPIGVICGEGTEGTSAARAEGTVISRADTQTSASASRGRTVYYVGENGSDTNAGDQAHPFREIRAGITAASAGDTIIVANGTYLGFDVKKSGGVGNPITVIAPEKNATVTVTTDRPDNRDTIFITGVSWIVVDGIKGFNGNRAGMRIDDCDNITVRNCTFGNNQNWGIFTDFSEDVTIEWCECYGSVFEHGIYFSNSMDRPIARNNTIHDNRGCGVHNNGDSSMGGDGLIQYAIIENNTIYNNGVGGGAGINLDGGQYCIIRNNVLYNNHASGITNYDGDAAAGPIGCEFYHNTIDMAADGRWALQIADTLGKVTVRNNILYTRSANRGGLSLGDANDVINVDSDYNIMDRVTPDAWTTIYTLAQWQALGHELHSISAPPTSLWVNAAGPDYHLRSNSSAIDKGQTLSSVTADKDGKARPIGNVSDIGAYEYGIPEPPDLTPPGAIIDLAVTGVTQIAVNLTWTAPGDNGTIGTAKSYDLRYSKNQITELNWTSATKVSGLPTPQVAGTKQSHNVTGLTPNTQYYFAIKALDKAGNIGALSNAVNATTLRIRPDLYITVSDILLSNQNPLEGDTVSIGTTVRVHNFTHNLSYVVDLLVDGVKVDNSSVFQSGAIGSAQWNWTAVKRDHNITVRVDSGNAIDETNESNNEATKAITVQERPIPPKPDIYVLAADISFSNANPIEGELVHITAKVRGANITQSISFSVDSFIDNAFRESRTPDLNGSMTVVTFNWIAVRGEHYYTIAVDPLNKIAESDEANNNATASLLAGGPDLSISASDIVLPGLSPLEGEQILLNITIHAINLFTITSINVELRVDGVQEAKLGDNVNNGNSSFLLLWKAVKGTHDITFVIDPGKVFNETDETNNEATRQITVREKPQPLQLDLYILPSEVTFGNGTPVDGTVVTISVVVHAVNMSAEVLATVVLLVDGITAGSNAIRLRPVPTASLTVVFSWEAVKGAHNITVKVDAGAGMTEPDLSNNMVMKQITVLTKGKPPNPPVGGDDSTMIIAALGLGIVLAVVIVVLVVMMRKKGQKPSDD